MKRKHIYSAVDVERLDVALILQALAVGCIVAIDVAKTKFVAALATATGEVLKLVKFDHGKRSRSWACSRRCAEPSSSRNW